MTPRAAALRYARALFDVAVKEKLDLERIEGELSAFGQLVATHEPLARIFFNPAVPAPRKRAIVEQLLARSPLSSPVSRLLLLLAERDRLTIFDELTRAFGERVMEYRQIVRAEVTTAIPLTPDRVNAVQQGLAHATGRRVQLATKVDPSIIGGAVTRIGSTVYDGSVLTQLHRLRETLAQADT
jgi:F-type H+-transporting ATPase subunit delta